MEKRIHKQTQMHTHTHRHIGSREKKNNKKDWNAENRGNIEMCTFLNNMSRKRNPNVFDLRLIALFHFIYWLGNCCCFLVLLLLLLFLSFVAVVLFHLVSCCFYIGLRMRMWVSEEGRGEFVRGSVYVWWHLRSHWKWD